MKTKNGFTITMLIIYIIVISIAFGITAYKFTNSGKLENVEEVTFKARIRDYIEEYNKNKNYNIVIGNDISNMTIEELIPTITYDDKKFLKLSNTGSLIFYNLEESDIRYQYLLDLDLSEFNIEILDLQLDVGKSDSYGGLQISIDQEGIITINGTYNNSDKGVFFRLSNGLTHLNSYPGLAQTNKIIANSGDRVRLEFEKIDGSLEKLVSTSQFNVGLRDQNGNANNVIRILDYASKNPTNDTFSLCSHNLNYLYFFIKGNVVFTNYKIRISLLKDNSIIEPVQSNQFNLFKGLVQNTGDLSITVLDNLDIKINGTSNLERLYVIFLKNSSVGVINSATPIAGYITNQEYIMDNGKTIKFEVQEISGSVNIPTGQNFNVVLRGYDTNTSPTSSPIVTYNNNPNNEFNCKFANGIKSITGEITGGPVRVLGLYITNYVVFTDYIIRPVITIIP